MNVFRHIITGSVLALIIISSSARADNLATVRVFYDFLSDLSSEAKAVIVRSGATGTPTG